MVDSEISVILLAGGAGSRMQSAIPKQYMLLNDKPVAQYSLDVFAAFPDVKEIVIVAAMEYRHYFDLSSCGVSVNFALPGARRQDSVYNGLQAIKHSALLVCIHDTARPFISCDMIERVKNNAAIYGAATAAMPVKFTVKQGNAACQVVQTLDRSILWEIQTPQILKHDILKQGFDYVLEHDLTVTDDVSLAELIGVPVQLVEGCYRNLKLTTPEDLKICLGFV